MFPQIKPTKINLSLFGRFTNEVAVEWFLFGRKKPIFRNYFTATYWGVAY